VEQKEGFVEMSRQAASGKRRPVTGIRDIETLHRPPKL